MIKVTYTDMLGRVNESVLDGALAYASMAYEGMGYKTPIMDANGNPIDYYFNARCIAKVA